MNRPLAAALAMFATVERLGTLKPGREWFSTRLTCPPGGSPPILIP